MVIKVKKNRYKKVKRTTKRSLKRTTKRSLKRKTFKNNKRRKNRTKQNKSATTQQVTGGALVYQPESKYYRYKEFTYNEYAGGNLGFVLNYPVFCKNLPHGYVWVKNQIFKTWKRKYIKIEGESLNIYDKEDQTSTNGNSIEDLTGVTVEVSSIEIPSIQMGIASQLSQKKELLTIKQGSNILACFAFTPETNNTYMNMFVNAINFISGDLNWNRKYTNIGYATNNIEVLSTHNIPRFSDVTETEWGSQQGKDELLGQELNLQDSMKQLETIRPTELDCVPIMHAPETFYLLCPGTNNQFGKWRRRPNALWQSYFHKLVDTGEPDMMGFSQNTPQTIDIEKGPNMNNKGIILNGSKNPYIIRVLSGSKKGKIIVQPIESGIHESYTTTMGIYKEIRFGMGQSMVANTVSLTTGEMRICNTDKSGEGICGTYSIAVGKGTGHGWSHENTIKHMKGTGQLDQHKEYYTTSDIFRGCSDKAYNCILQQLHNLNIPEKSLACISTSQGSALTLTALMVPGNLKNVRCIALCSPAMTWKKGGQIMPPNIEAIKDILSNCKINNIPIILIDTEHGDQNLETTSETWNKEVRTYCNETKGSLGSLNLYLPGTNHAIDPYPERTTRQKEQSKINEIFAWLYKWCKTYDPRLRNVYTSFMEEVAHELTQLQEGSR